MTDVFSSVVAAPPEVLEVVTTEQLVTLSSGPTEVLEVNGRFEAVEVTQVSEILEVTAPVVEILEIGIQGPAGAAGSSAVGLFILDVQPTTGIIGQKTYKPGTVPASANLASAVSDTAAVRIIVGANGGSNSYSPTMSVNGVDVVLTESTTKRWFTGYADITLHAGANTILATSSDGGVDRATITLAGAGPAVQGMAFGAYPGAQTELKAGDTVTVTVLTDMDAVAVTLSGPVAPQTLTVMNGVAAGLLMVGTGSGNLPVTAIARNALGTQGAAFLSAPLVLNQTAPSFSPVMVSYPAGHGALGVGESATVTCTVTDADTVTYDSPDLNVAAGYAPTKTAALTATGYKNSGTNYTIHATRAANGAQASVSALVAYATVAPSASINILGNPPRLASSPAGTDYEVRIIPTQKLLSAPVVNATKGAWQGSWADHGAYWSRLLRITDDVARGAGSFTGLGLTGLSGLLGSTIDSGAGYTVGGFSSRTLTFPAFSRVVALGTTVGDPTKLVAQLTGGAMQTRYSDNGVHSAGFYPANADGSYNGNGTYLGLSDAAFAGANTSGTLQITVQENA